MTDMQGAKAALEVTTEVFKGLQASVVASAERVVIEMAREYRRTDGAVAAHNELMDAVDRLERATAEAGERVACFCGTGREHVRGQGYFCRAAMTCPDHPGPLDDARDHVCRPRP